MPNRKWGVAMSGGGFVYIGDSNDHTVPVVLVIKSYMFVLLFLGVEL